MKWWGWLIAGLAVGAGAFAVIWYWLQGRNQDAAKASVDMMVEWHRQDVAQKKQRINELLEDFDANAERIVKLRKKLDEKRARLEADYVDKGLTADEISERLNRISL